MIFKSRSPEFERMDLEPLTETSAADILKTLEKSMSGWGCACDSMASEAVLRPLESETANPDY